MRCCGSVLTQQAVMKVQRVGEHCYAAISDQSGAFHSNSGLVAAGRGLVIDTQADLPHARQMMALFGTVWRGRPQLVVNTHEDGDHVWGNQLFEGAEIIAHRSVRERMPQVADPLRIRELIQASQSVLPRPPLADHRGLLAMAWQLCRHFDFEGVRLVLPTTVFDKRRVLDLDGTEAQLIYVGGCHQVGDTIVHLAGDRVVFAGDVVFRCSTPMGWNGSYAKWFEVLDLIISLDPEVIVPGHGPVCGIEGAMEMKAYLEYVLEESRRCYDVGLDALDAAKKIPLGPYAHWNAPARLYLNVARAYREFRHEAADAPWDRAQAFDAMLAVARDRGLAVEF
jgi:glyoxylase-like metal-dependent hydrolase (beta-lactamase superfamily II)